MSFTRQRYSVDTETFTRTKLLASGGAGGGVLGLFVAAVGAIMPVGEGLGLGEMAIAMLSTVGLGVLCTLPGFFLDPATKAARRKSRSYPHLSKEVAEVLRGASAPLASAQDDFRLLDSPPVEVRDSFERLYAWEGEIITALGATQVMKSEARVAFAKELVAEYALKASDFAAVVNALLKEQRTEEESTARRNASALVADRAGRLVSSNQAAQSSFEEMSLRVAANKSARKEVETIKEGLLSQ